MLNPDYTVATIAERDLIWDVPQSWMPIGTTCLVTDTNTVYYVVGYVQEFIWIAPNHQQWAYVYFDGALPFWRDSSQPTWSIYELVPNEYGLRVYSPSGDVRFKTGEYLGHVVLKKVLGAKETSFFTLPNNEFDQWWKIKILTWPLSTAAYNTWISGGTNIYYGNGEPHIVTFNDTLVPVTETSFAQDPDTLQTVSYDWTNYYHSGTINWTPRYASNNQLSILTVVAFNTTW